MSATLHENILTCSLLIRAFGEDRPEVQDRSETSEKSMAATDNELNLDEPTTTTWGSEMKTRGRILSNTN